MMKKIVSVVLVVVLMLVLSVSIYAQDADKNVYTYGNVTVMFENDSTLSQEQQSHIANAIVNGNDNTSTYNLMCTLFGHKFDQTEGVTTITHEVSPTEPRCYKEYFIVNICSRCQEEGQIESLGGEYIVCCPVK